MTNNNKPSQQEMIDAIYNKIARKDLSFGCRIKFTETSKIRTGTIGKITSAKPLDFVYLTIDGEEIRSIFPRDLHDTTEIIGHPVMIGDVMDYFQENPTGILELYGVEYNSKGRINLPKNIFILWKNKRKPIEDQSSDCIGFVYNLISE